MDKEKEKAKEKMKVNSGLLNAKLKTKMGSRTKVEWLDSKYISDEEQQKLEGIVKNKMNAIDLKKRQRITD